LPDEALHKLFEKKIISDIQSGDGQNSNVKLTELNNKPVYEIKGENHKKFLFFVPVSIPKTTYVSAENGESVSTQQTPFSKILDTISF